MNVNVEKSLKDLDKLKEGLPRTAQNLGNVFIQPWSTPIMKTTLPPEVLAKMLEITDGIRSSNDPESVGHTLAGQIEMELNIERETLKKHGLLNYFATAITDFVKHALTQGRPERQAEILAETYLTEIQKMWMVSQYSGEYNPIHHHNGCHISAVLYLKLPEMEEPIKNRSNGFIDDGAIEFIGSTSADFTFARPCIRLEPRVGDFYLFSANQLHTVYPFRSAADHIRAERRSVAFNAIFQSKTDFKEGKPLIVVKNDA